MKKTLAIITLAAGLGQILSAADTTNKVEQSVGRVWLSDVSLEPYGTVAWRGVDGRAIYGAGANVVSHITKGFSIWGFGESDNTEHSVIDRGGGGVRFEGWLGKHIKGDAGIGLAYNFEKEYFFTRVPVGLTVDVLQAKNIDLGIRATYAFDISGNTKFGTADGRAFIGPVLNIKW